MKLIVRVITVIAMMLIWIGGAAMDSQNILIPVLMVLPGLAWLGLIAWVNSEG